MQNAMHLFDQIISKCGHDRLLSQKTSDLCFIETLAMTCYLIARKMVGSPVGGELYSWQLIEVMNKYKCAYCLAPTADKQKQIRWNYLVDMRQDTPSVENMIKIEGEILQKLNWKVRVPPPVHTRTRHSLPAISCRGMPSHPSLTSLSQQVHTVLPSHHLEFLMSHTHLRHQLRELKHCDYKKRLPESHGHAVVQHAQFLCDASYRFFYNEDHRTVAAASILGGLYLMRAHRSVLVQATSDLLKRPLPPLSRPPRQARGGAGASHLRRARIDRGEARAMHAHPRPRVRIRPRAARSRQADAQALLLLIRGLSRPADEDVALRLLPLVPLLVAHPSRPPVCCRS